MLHHLAPLFLLVAVAQADIPRQFRLNRVELSCAQPQVCPESATGLLEFRFGDKNPQSTGSFKAEYHESGEVSFTATANGGSNAVSYSTVVVGDGVSDKCKDIGRSGSEVNLNRLRFDECGFQQNFHGNTVHRSIVVKVRHHFRTGAVDSASKSVTFIGYRDIRVDFYLAPEDPVSVAVVPDEPRGTAENNVCVDLKHRLTTYRSNQTYFWHVKVSAVDLVSSALGVGFKLQDCYAAPYVKGNVDDAVHPTLKAYFLKNGVLDQGLLFDQRTISDYEVTRGQSYAFSFHALEPNLPQDQFVDGKKHQIHCSVCLCNLLDGENQCPTEIAVGSIYNDLNGRNMSPYRLIDTDAVPVAGSARQVLPRGRQAKSRVFGGK